MSKPKVVIIGAGFGGLYAAKTLAKASVEITLIDRNNFHTFTPLLYQVATCALDPSSIAYPVRTIFRKQDNIQFLMGEVTELDTDRNIIHVKTANENREQPYDYLIIATGSVNNHYGNQAIAENTFGLKTLDDSLILRNHILSLFERAAWAQSEIEKDALTTMVVVGGGPTGLETAGAMFELYNHVLKQEFRQHKPHLRARVILLEASDKLLMPYPEKLQQAAEKQLEKIGVEVILNARVESVDDKSLTLADGREIATHTVVWSAGVKAPKLAEELNVELKAQGRIPILHTTQVMGYDNIFAVGDNAYLQDEKGQPYPMLIPVAKQQGILAANNIISLINQSTLNEFTYHDRGIMATIGRTRAVAWIFYRVQLTGFLAWLSWLFLHLIVLLGFRNRMSVFISWIWNYITYDRSVRLILNDASTSQTEEKSSESEKIAA